jgi:2-hydroxy-3-keto-5-methylthiopentenyl-1-phosphate phosphatase
MKILVTDFDSTLTQRDFYALVRERWPIPADDDPWAHYLEGRLTHFEALEAIFARIRASEKELLTLAEQMGLDPQLAESVQALHDAGWTVVIASAGCEWYIKHLLTSVGLDLQIHSNPGTFDPERGLQMRLPSESPFFDATTGVNKAQIVQDALARAEQVAFAGDGRPDLEPALLVKTPLRFARGWLAEALQSRGEGFQSFDRWSQVARKLLC